MITFNLDKETLQNLKPWQIIFMIISILIVALTFLYQALNADDKIITNNINIEIPSREEAKKNLKTYTDDKANQVLDLYQDVVKEMAKNVATGYRGQDTFHMEQRVSFKDVQNQLSEIRMIVQMNSNSDIVIEKAVDSMYNDVMNNLKNNLEIKEKFFNVKLKELDEILNKALENLEHKELNEKENKKLYAQINMVKSITYYLSYNAKEAYSYYIRAKTAYPALTVINDLKKEYHDITPEGVNIRHYGYVQLTLLATTKELMNMSAKNILGVGNALKLEKKGYPLSLEVVNIQGKPKIRIYTILEYCDDYTYDLKLEEIENIIKNPLKIHEQTNIPEEYIMRDNRKKIFVYRSSKNNTDVDSSLVKELKDDNVKHIVSRGPWNHQYGMYALYYDGVSVDMKDMTNFIKSVKKSLPTHEVKIFSYQQTESRKIQKLFNDKNLKYVLILEENAYVLK